jgi:hypothetical protein
LLLLAVPAQADSLAVTAALDPETGAVDGALAWTVSNPTRAPIDHVELFVYPRIYRDDPKLDDVLEPRVYPFAFDPGDQRLLCDHSEVVTEPEGLPVARIDLPAPLAPGATTEVICGFTTTIPVRYGTFGRLRQTVTLNGGLSPLPVTLAPDGRWLHQAPPPRIEQTLQLDVPDGWGAVVGGAIQDPADCELVADAIPRTGPRSWLPVSVHEDLQRQSIPLADGQTATWVGRELRRRQKRWVRRAVEGARRTLAEAGLPAPERGVVLIEAPLRRNLVEPGDGVIFVSDRFLETAEIFWRYHDLHLARAVMAEQLRDLVDVREQPLHVPTTLHGVSWTLVPRYLRQRWKNHVNLKQLLEGVRFLPAIDNLLETPIFPFADQIFDDPWVVDPIRADVARFNRPLRSGRALFLELEDLVGRQTLDRTVDAYVAGQGDGDLWALLEARSGRDVRAQAEHWLLPASRVNLRVESVQRSRTDDGFHQTRVTARREVLQGEVADRAIELRLNSARPGRRGRVTLKWEGSEGVAGWEVRTAGRVGSVIVDPRGRVLEVDEEGISLKRDNRLPHTVRVTATGYLIALDFTGLGVEAYGALNFRPLHDTRHHVMTRVYTEPETQVGAGVSYVRYFGKQRSGSYRRNRFVVGLDLEWLNPRYQPTGVPFVLEASGSFVHETRQDSYFPTRGFRLQAKVFGGKDLALVDDHLRPAGETLYGGFDLLGVALVRLHPWQVIALRARLGLVAGNVAHRKFSLGGLDDLRGIPLNHVLGSFRVSGTVEWRHFFFRDRDLRLPLFRLRGMQGGLFVEAGLVADDLKAGPRTDELGVSIGYGLRFYGDWFGHLPAVGGIEIAWSPGAPPGRIPVFDTYEHWPEVPFQVYVVGSQSF